MQFSRLLRIQIKKLIFRLQREIFLSGLAGLRFSKAGLTTLHVCIQGNIWRTCFVSLAMATLFDWRVHNDNNNFKYEEFAFVPLAMATLSSWRVHDDNNNFNYEQFAFVPLAMATLSGWRVHDDNNNIKAGKIAPQLSDFRQLSPCELDTILGCPN